MVYRNRTIPDTETGIRRFVYSFSRTIAADPAIYHLTPADADLLSAEADALIAASVTASRPITRTRPNIHARNDLYKRVLPIFRSYVKQIRAHHDIAAADLVRVGLVLERRRKSPTPAPVQPPHLSATLDPGGRQRLQYMTPGISSQRKPRGATHLVLLCHVTGDTATPTVPTVPSPDTARYVGAFTRNRILLHHPPEHDGRTATYFAAWLMGNGQQTPWSRPLSLRIINTAAHHLPMVHAA